MGPAADAGEQIVEDVTDAIGDVIDQASDVVNDAADFVGDVGTSAWKGVDAIGTFVDDTIRNPASITKDPMKAVTLAIAVAMAVPSGGTSMASWAALGAWVVVQSGATYAVLKELADEGYISEMVAFIGSAIANIAVTYYGMTTSMGTWSSSTLPSMPLQLHWETAHFLVSMGVSVETALIVAESVYTLASCLSYFKIIFDVIDIYGVYQAYLKMEAQLKSMQAAYEAWMKKMLEKTAIEDNFISNFVNGDAMKYYPGQQMFAAINPGREYYTSVEGQLAGSVMVGGKLIDSDITVARITFDEPSYDWAGNSGYMNTLLDYPKFWRSSIGQ